MVDNDDIELIVANNASTDNTDSIIKKYMLNGNEIKYINRIENIGPDGNFADCFNQAKGKYFWIIGDDDFLLSDTLYKIVAILKQDDYGAVFLNGSIGYTNEKDLLNYSLVSKEVLEKQVYHDPILFFEHYNYWATFITGNIINRSLIYNKINPLEFANTYLIQLGWNIPAVFSSKKNMIIIDETIVCKGDNTGGYKLFEVFGKNYNKILDSLIKKGYDKRIKSITNRHLIKTFFPVYSRSSVNKFEKENHIKILLPIYWHYKAFWKMILFNYLKRIIKSYKMAFNIL